MIPYFFMKSKFFVSKISFIKDFLGRKENNNSFLKDLGQSNYFFPEEHPVSFVFFVSFVSWIDFNVFSLIGPGEHLFSWVAFDYPKSVLCNLTKSRETFSWKWLTISLIFSLIFFTSFWSYRRVCNIFFPGFPLVKIEFYFLQKEQTNLNSSDFWTPIFFTGEYS